MTEPELIHVLLADDHDIVRSGLKAALRGHPEFTVVGEARDGKEAVREAKRLKPELAVLDVRMPGLNGIEACREIRQASPQTNVLMLTSYADEKAVITAILAGASGFAWPDASFVTGLSFQRSRVRHGDVTDGFTTTYLVAEKHLRRDRYETGDDLGDNETALSGDDRDLVRFTGGEFDVTFKPSGKRERMEEVGLYTVDNGKIVREHFFYNPASA